MHAFTLSFDVKNKAVQSPAFEENLALRLLDVLYGRNSQCLPDPVPLTLPGGDMRMIGLQNNTWLKREDAATYTVVSRYWDDEIKADLARTEKTIRQEYADILLPVTPAKAVAATVKGFKR